MTPKEWGDMPAEDRMYLEAAALEENRRAKERQSEYE